MTPLCRPANFPSIVALAIFSLLFSVKNIAQNGCPGCLTSLPATLPADTIFLEKIPNGFQNQPFEADISFRMPKSTTPVHAVDSTTPAGLPISKIKVLSVTGLPPGLDWTPSKTSFDTGNGDTDGCFKICGTPVKSDSFKILVNLEATVLFFTQTATFTMTMFVEPLVQVNDGFSMTGFESCGPTTVFFQNQVPSGGNPNFTYTWEFGNGFTTTAENPLPQTYSQPGNYPINYTATIDTAAHKLLTINVLAASCDDTNFPPIWNAAPDIYVLIKNQSGDIVFDSSPDISNANLPLAVIVNQNLSPDDNFTLEVWDNDSGLAGEDDLCGIINFSTNSSGIALQNGDLTASFDIFHPILTVETTDTVRVFEIPQKPLFETYPAPSVCLGDSIHLLSLKPTGNQWFIDGQAIAGANDYFYSTTVGGNFHLIYTTSEGCTASSDTIALTIKPLPAEPKFYISQNVLTLLAPNQLPQSYELHWYVNDSLIASQIDFDLCAAVSGMYTLEVLDLETGCSNRFEQNVIVDPNIDCTTRVSEKIEQQTRPFDIFPNPTTGEMWLLTKNGGLGMLEISVWSVSGVQLGDAIFGQSDSPTGVSINLTSLPDGLYLLKIKMPDGRIWGERVLLQR